MYRCSGCIGKEIVLETHPYLAVPPPLVVPNNRQGGPSGFLPELLELVADKIRVKLMMKMHTVETYFDNLKFTNFVDGRTNALLESSTHRQLSYLWAEADHYGEGFGNFSRMMPLLTPVYLMSDTGSYGSLFLQTKAADVGWRLFHPFTVSLWGILVAVAAFGLGQASPCKRCCQGSVPRAWVLSGEDYEFVTWPGLVLLLGMLFFVLVTSATYTDNLTAFFTAPALHVQGPQQLCTLQETVVHVPTKWESDPRGPLRQRRHPWQ